MKAIMTVALGAFGAGMLIGAGLMAIVSRTPEVVWPGTPEGETFNECVLDRMRGVPGDLSPIAVAVCQQRHPGETLVLPVAQKKPNPFDRFDDGPTAKTANPP